MRSEVAHQIELGEELPLTRLHMALEPLIALVHFPVLVQVCTLGERVSTARHFAHEWPVLCVDPQMVEEIVPLLEGLATLEAKQLLHDSFAPRVFELENEVVSRFWNLAFRYFFG